MSTNFSAPDGPPARRAAGHDASETGGPAKRAADSHSFGGSVGWTVLGAIVPGLGLWRAGRRVAGALAMAVFALIVAGGVYLALNRSLVSSLALAPGVLQTAAIGLLVAGLLWVVVIGVTHLSLRPVSPTVGQRAAGAAVVGLLSFVVAAPMAVGANMAWTTAGAVDKIFGTDNETPNSTQPTINAVDPWQDKDRLNILIIGGDSGTGRSAAAGDRTDTVIVASIDTHSGATTLFTLPRNTEKMPFPKNSPLHKYYPNGFTSGSTDLYTRSQFLLNAMYRVVPATVPHDVLGKTKDFGASVMKVSVGEALGLDVDYFVKVNMDGFKDFINAIGGITVNVNYRIPIGGQTDAGIKPDGYIEPGPDQHFNGRLALWYARGRYGLDDYKRMERQRCVINAVVQQTTPDKVLTNYQAIASAGENTIETDVPRTLLPALVDLGLKVKGTKLRSVVFTPKTGFSSSNPDWPAAQKKVQKALKETKADADDETSGTKKKKTKSDDLAKICGYHPES